MTSKLQVTIPKVIAARYGITPGSDVEWLPARDAIRVVPHTESPPATDRDRRLALFDNATERQRGREKQTGRRRTPPGRGWTREDLYQRGKPR